MQDLDENGPAGASRDGMPAEAPIPRVVQAETIDPKLIDADALRIIRRLRRNGHEAYLVGGCVRDLLLDKSPKDFDVITSARPNQVRRMFSNSRVIGRRFRLVHVLFSENMIEVSTFRALSTPGVKQKHLVDGNDEGRTPDPRTGGRRNRHVPEDPSIYGEAWQDAYRRDFTVNALLYDPDSREITDYVGGLKDVERRLIRAIREPKIALYEDPVRMLRAIRFAAKLNFQIEEETLAALREYAHRIELCSPRRLFEEILKILGQGYARPTLSLLIEHGVLAPLLPEIRNWIGTDLADPVQPTEVVVEEPEEASLPDQPIVYYEQDAFEAELNLEPISDWEPAPYAVSALVQVSRTRPPLEGSNEWKYNPEDELADDMYEANCFARDATLEHYGQADSAGLRADREKASSVLKLLKLNGLVEPRLERFVLDNLEAGRARLLAERLRIGGDYQPIASRRDRFLRYMAGLDSLHELGIPLSGPLMLSALFSSLLEEIPKGELVARVDEILSPMVERQCLSKRDRDMTQQLLQLQHRVRVQARRRPEQRRRRRRRPVRQPSKRSQLDEALLLEWVRCQVDGASWLDFLSWEESVYADSAGAQPVTHRITSSLDREPPPSTPAPSRPQHQERSHHHRRTGGGGRRRRQR